jgi:peptidoglycan/LPS O-acetylase OafA/YrhL
MELNEKMRYALILEALLVAALVAAINFYPETASRYMLWEVFPAIIAAMITTYGLKEMKRRT